MMKLNVLFNEKPQIINGFKSLPAKNWGNITKCNLILNKEGVHKTHYIVISTSYVLKYIGCMI